MKLSLFVSKVKNIEGENRLLRFAIIVIGITTLINTGLLYSSLNSHRTVIVPPTIHSKFEIYGNKATDEYYKEFARYIASLAFSYNPATVRAQFTELMGMYTSEGYTEAQRFFYDLADKIETSKASSVFYLRQLNVDDNKKEIYIEGLQVQYASNGVKIDEKAKKYVIEYRVSNGRFAIHKIYEKEA